MVPPDPVDGASHDGPEATPGRAGDAGDAGDAEDEQRERLRQEHDEEAQWGERAHSEPRWPASLAVVVSIALFVVLPQRLISGLGPRWLVPSLEGVLVATLLIASPRITRPSTRLRTVAIILIAFVNLANVVSLGQLVHELLASSHGSPGGRALIYASVPIWITNVLVFGLWYWELDRGGPAHRLLTERRQPDFLFPQMTAPEATGPDWSPKFLDYLYVS
ncbi:MAG: hypothetical protein ABSG81_14745, partial [Acidimicrobiales bacterium]